MSTRTVFALAMPLVFSSLITAAECPPSVKDAALAAHPGATVSACKQETEHGATQFEVKLALKSGGQISVDVSPEGKILLTEEYVAIDTVPPAVIQAVKAKHPDAKPLKAEKQTDARGKVTYEIAFEAAGKKQEGTFTADGKVVEEEEAGEKGQD